MKDKEQIDDNMILTVAGKDRTVDLGQTVVAEAETLDDPALRELISGEVLILDLAKSGNESEFIDRQLKTFGMRTQLDLGKCKLPDNSSAGFIGRVIGGVRNFVWRLLRFAFEWTLFHQNMINEQQAVTLAHEVRLRKRENAELRKRIELLESRMGSKEEDHS